MSELTSKASYITSAAVTFGGGLSLNEFVALAGIVLGVGTFLVNWRYKHLHYKMERAKNVAEKKCN